MLAETAATLQVSIFTSVGILVNDNGANAFA